MWFQRVISWFRALFSARGDADEAPTVDDMRLDPLAPMNGPEFTRRQLLYPRDSLKSFGLGAPHDTLPLMPAHYESPKTIPLFRLSSQYDLRYETPPETRLPVTSEPTAPLVSHEPAQPASEPLSTNLQRLSDVPDSLDSFDQMGDLDDMTRRLLFLRRLVRQRVYNEGFAADETPRQYRHSLGLTDDPDQPASHN